MKKKILCLCTGNSCRSQMAEAFLKHYLDAQYEVYSAGTKPSHVNPYAITVMKELGMDISNQSSKHIDALKDIDFDVVLTVCDHARENCPIYWGNTRKLHWSFEDPAAATGAEEDILQKFRDIRDQIKSFCRDMLQTDYLFEEL